MGSSENEVGNINDKVELLQAQEEVTKHLFAYADSLVLRAAIELRIADIIHSNGQPMSLSELASKIESPSPTNLSSLARIMRVLVRKKVFTVEYEQMSLSSSHELPVLGIALYGLTPTSKCLLHDQELSFAPIFLTFTHPLMVDGWFEIGRSITEGGTPFELAHGAPLWEMTSKDPKVNRLFIDGMTAATNSSLDAIISGYEDGFNKMEGSLVDVGGNVGKLVSFIVKTYPHIKGINFDVPPTIANAPQYPGVTHVGGDMFKEIPSADNVIIKSVLHDWGDEEALLILKKCREAVAEKKGKVIIVDVVLHPDRHEMFDDASIALDLLMMVTFSGAKERTEDEWMNLLNEAGFTHINFIPLQTSMTYSIIEASN